MNYNPFLRHMGLNEVFSSTPLDRTQSKTTEIKPALNKKMPSPISANNLSHIQALENLRKSIENFEGCALKKTALNLVFSDGNPKAQIMLIGEAPGADEDRQGKPFVGMSGQLLTRAFQSAGFEREKDLYISNSIFWRPPGNRQPTSQELDACWPFTQRHIELINPKVLILVGSTAVKSVLKTTEGITKIRGQWMEYNSPGLPAPISAMAIYHPAYLLRSPGRKKEFWLDLLKISERLK